MEESPQQRSRVGSGIATGVAIFVAIYFFFPFVLVAPLRIAFHGNLPRRAETVLDTVFWPVEKLYKVCPPYTKLMDAERDLFVRIR